MSNGCKVCELKELHQQMMKTSSSQRLSVKKGNNIRFSRFSPLITKINHCCLSYHSSVLKVHFRIRDVTFKESKGYQKVK